MRIEGASPEQREILERILAGLPSTQMRVLRVAPEYDLEPEPDAEGNPPPDWDPNRPLGDALWLVDPQWPDTRTEWELELVGAAFDSASAEADLTPVVAVMSQQGGSPPRGGAVVSRPPVYPAQEEARIRRAAVGSGADVERIEFVQLEGVAVAVRLRVPEPHTFLRERLREFVEASGHNDRSRLSSYLEIFDDDPRPAYASAPGMTSARRDVLCCAPIRRGALFAPPPPPCSVYGGWA